MTVILNLIAGSLFLSIASTSHLFKSYRVGYIKLMINIGMVGIGRWGKNLLRELDKVSVVRTCYHHGNVKNRHWLKKHYPRIRIVSSYTALLDDPIIQAVVIATPIKTHFPLVREALRAGKHVFVEKPLAENLQQVTELATIAKKYNLVLFIGHIFLYHPIFKKISDLTRKDPIMSAYFSWNKFGTFSEDIVANLVSHDVAIAIAIFGAPRRVKLLYQKGVLTKRDIVGLRLYFSPARDCIIQINRVSNTTDKSALFITKKSRYIWQNDLLYKINSRRPRVIFKSSIQPLANECLSFINSIKGGPYRTNGDFAALVTTALTKIR